MEQYITLKDYRLWKSIEEGPTVIKVKLADGSEMDKAVNSYNAEDWAKVSLDKQAFATITMALAPRVLSGFR